MHAAALRGAAGGCRLRWPAAWDTSYLEDIRGRVRLTCGMTWDFSLLDGLG